MYVCMYVCMYVYIVYIYIYTIYVYIYIYIYMCACTDGSGAGSGCAAADPVPRVGVCVCVRNACLAVWLHLPTFSASMQVARCAKKCLCVYVLCVCVCVRGARCSRPSEEDSSDTTMLESRKSRRYPLPSSGQAGKHTGKRPRQHYIIALLAYT